MHATFIATGLKFSSHCLIFNVLSYFNAAVRDSAVSILCSCVKASCTVSVCVLVFSVWSQLYTYLLLKNVP